MVKGHWGRMAVCGLAVVNTEDKKMVLISSHNAGEYLNCPLRAVLCDDFFVKHKYPLKECLILNFLRDKDKDWALAYAKKNLGYIPSTLRDS